MIVRMGTIDRNRRSNRRDGVAQDKILEAPKDVAELKKLIVSRNREFPESLKRVLELSFMQPEAIAFSNASSLAADCQIAPSSVSRSVKALGYRSFRDFRQIYRNHILMLSRRSSFASPGDTAMGGLSSS